VSSSSSAAFSCADDSDDDDSDDSGGIYFFSEVKFPELPNFQAANIKKERRNLEISEKVFIFAASKL